MSTMLDRGDHDEFLPNCPWTMEDGQFCDAHDVELAVLLDIVQRSLLQDDARLIFLEMPLQDSLSPTTSNTKHLS